MRVERRKAFTQSSIVGALVSALVALLSVYVAHRGNEKRLQRRLDHDRQQKRVERRAEIVADLYSKLVDLRKAAFNFVHWYNSVDEKNKRHHLKQLWRAADAFDGHFGRNRIYVDYAICNSIDTLRDSLSTATSVLAGFVVDAGSIAVSDDQLFEEWKKAVVILEREVPRITESLDAHFRELLDMETTT